MGCVELTGRLWGVRPKVHVFGHVHAGYWIRVMRFDDIQEGYGRELAARENSWNEGKGAGVVGAYLAFHVRRQLENQEEGLELEVVMPEKIRLPDGEVPRARNLEGQETIFVNAATMGGGGARKGIVVEV